MSRLSIIVPACGLQEQIDDTLVSVLEHRPDDCEVIVAHARSYQDPYDLGDEVRFVCGASNDLTTLFNEGVQHAKSDIVHLLEPGTLVTANWCDAPLEQFDEDEELICLSPILLDTNTTDTLVAAGVRYQANGACHRVAERSKLAKLARVTVDAPTLHAGFYDRVGFLSLGGFCPTMGYELADVDLAARLRLANAKCGVSRQSHITFAATRPTYSRLLVRRKEQLFWRYMGSYRASLVAHASHVLGQIAYSTLCFRPMSEVTGRLGGWMDSWKDKANRVQLSAAEPAELDDHHSDVLSMEDYRTGSTSGETLRRTGTDG